MLTHEEQQMLDTAIATLFNISQDVNSSTSNKCIDLRHSLADVNYSDVLQLAYDLRPKLTHYPGSSSILELLKDEIASLHDNMLDEIQEDILKKAGFPMEGDKAEYAYDYISSNYSYNLPFDDYLCQNMRVNLLLGLTEESNCDFAIIGDQYHAIAGLLSATAADALLKKPSALRWLVEQQGYTMSDLAHAFQEYQECMYGSANKHLSDNTKLSSFHNFHSFFLSSVCQELENTVNSMNTLTVLTDFTMYDYCELLQPGKELVMPRNTVLGLFSPWQGGGSTMAIRLEHELFIPSELIWDIQVEDVKLLNQHSVDNIYGLPSQAWKKPLLLRDKPVSLDRQVKGAERHTQNDSVPGQISRHDPVR